MASLSDFQRAITEAAPSGAPLFRIPSTFSEAMMNVSEVVQLMAASLIAGLAFGIVLGPIGAAIGVLVTASFGGLL